MNKKSTTTNQSSFDYLSTRIFAVRGIAVGWGLRRNQTFVYPPARPLQEIQVPILSTEACQRDLYDKEITDDVICPKSGKDTGACFDDHGCPLFIYNEVEDEHVKSE